MRLFLYTQISGSFVLSFIYLLLFSFADTKFSNKLSSFRALIGLSKANNLETHPLRTSKWEFKPQRNLFSRSTYKTFTLFFDKQGNVTSTQGYKGKYQVNYNGLTWNLKVPVFKESEKNLKRQSFVDRLFGISPVYYEALHSLSSHQKIKSQGFNAPIVNLHFFAEMHWNAFGPMPKMYAGTILADRVEKTTNLFRPVLASFSGEGKN